jgi:hypothetical protein
MRSLIKVQSPNLFRPKLTPLLHKAETRGTAYFSAVNPCTTNDETFSARQRPCNKFLSRDIQVRQQMDLSSSQKREVERPTLMGLMILCNRPPFIVTDKNQLTFAGALRKFSA